MRETPAPQGTTADAINREASPRLRRLRRCGRSQRSTSAETDPQAEAPTTESWMSAMGDLTTKRGADRCRLRRIAAVDAGARRPLGRCARAPARDDGARRRVGGVAQARARGPGAARHPDQRARWRGQRAFRRRACRNARRARILDAAVAGIAVGAGAAAHRTPAFRTSPAGQNRPERSSIPAAPSAPWRKRPKSHRRRSSALRCSTSTPEEQAESPCRSDQPRSACPQREFRRRFSGADPGSFVMRPSQVSVACALHIQISCTRTGVL